MKRIDLRAAVLASLGACAAPAAGPERWNVEVAFEQDAKLGGCAVGNFDPDRPGNEIAVVNERGEVWMLWRADRRWESELVMRRPGELIQVAAGDLDPDHPGEELVAVGMQSGTEDSGGAGAAVLAWREGDGWRERELASDDALLHAVAVGEIDPTRPGPEVVVAGYSRSVHVGWLEGGNFESTVVAELPGPAKGVALERGAMVFACEDGSVVRVTRRGGEWASEVVASFADPQARIDAYDGALLVCDNGGYLRLVEPEPGGAEPRVTVVHKSPDRLRGAVFSGLDPAAEGIELATAGYDGWIVVVRRAGRGFRTYEIAHDTDRLHSLASGELPEVGPALVACGYSGRVLVVSRR